MPTMVPLAPALPDLRGAAHGHRRRPAALTAPRGVAARVQVRRQEAPAVLRCGPFWGVVGGSLTVSGSRTTVIGGQRPGVGCTTLERPVRWAACCPHRPDERNRPFIRGSWPFPARPLGEFIGREDDVARGPRCVLKGEPGIGDDSLRRTGPPADRCRRRVQGGQRRRRTTPRPGPEGSWHDDHRHRRRTHRRGALHHRRPLCAGRVAPWCCAGNPASCHRWIWSPGVDPQRRSRVKGHFRCPKP